MPGIPSFLWNPPPVWYTYVDWAPPPPEARKPAELAFIKACLHEGARGAQRCEAGSVLINLLARGDVISDVLDLYRSEGQPGWRTFVWKGPQKEVARVDYLRPEEMVVLREGLNVRRGATHLVAFWGAVETLRKIL
jgi:hypothetical protein